MTRILVGLWDTEAKELRIRRTNGQERKVRHSSITAGSHKVFGVETVDDEIHVLTGPRTNRQPTRRVMFSDAGVYRGMKSMSSS